MLDKTKFLGFVGVLAIGTAVMFSFATEQKNAPNFTSGGKIMTHEQITEKLQSEGFSDVQIQQQGTNIFVTGVKNGKIQSATVDAETGSIVTDDDDDD